ncbi:MAG: DUF5615 family PIN-like protein [Chloroflexi bacterium]|nr:DUF5615 family PIN-like protein [Chloroflexota bacterium]
MKLLVDQNLSPHLVRRLADLFPGSSHVSLVGLERASDPVLRPTGHPVRRARHSTPPSHQPVTAPATFARHVYCVGRRPGEGAKRPLRSIPCLRTCTIHACGSC